jgi:hypothetical protein
VSTAREPPEFPPPATLPPRAEAWLAVVAVALSFAVWRLLAVLAPVELSLDEPALVATVVVAAAITFALLALRASRPPWPDAPSLEAADAGRLGDVLPAPRYRPRRGPRMRIHAPCCHCGRIPVPPRRPSRILRRPVMPAHPEPVRAAIAPDPGHWRRPARIISRH